MFCFSSFFIAHKESIPPYDENFVHAYTDALDFEKRMSEVQDFQLTIDSLQKTETPQIHVIVIGESQNKRALSLYGNIIQTTPFLDSIRPSLYVFHNVTSEHAQTALMMRKLLTLSENEEDKDKEITEPNVIDFYKSAGFKTFWISAHSMYGLFDNYSHLLAKVDVPIFINKREGWTSGFKEHKVDAYLLPPLQKSLLDEAPKKVIFIHLMGSHFNYTDRYPKKYQAVNPEFDILKDNVHPNYINYLKSIHYTDWILSKIFKLVQKDSKASSFILYFSDHGEDAEPLNSCFCHADTTNNPETLEIPYFLWLSDTYKNENKDYVAFFNTYLNRSYETNMWIHSILDLSRLSHSKIDPSKSIFNKNFFPTIRQYDKLLRP